MSDTAFVGPRSRETARKLIDAAGEVGLSAKVIKTTNGGYLVPTEVVDYLDSLEDQALSQIAADIREVIEAAEAAKEKDSTVADEVPVEKKKPARAPRARRGAKASDAGEEKD